MRRFSPLIVAGLLVSAGIAAGLLMRARSSEAPRPVPSGGPCSGLTEAYQVQDCISRSAPVWTYVVISSRSDGKVHLAVKRGSVTAVEQELARLGIPPQLAQIEELQPARTGSEWVEGDGPPLAFRLLTSEKRLPPHTAMQGLDIIMRLAENAEQFRQDWALFQLGDGALPAVDWGRESALFVGLGESSSCPLRLESFSLPSADRLLAHVAYAGEVYVCTSDYSPRTFVAAVPRDRLPPGALRGTIKGMFREPMITLR